MGQEEPDLWRDRYRVLFETNIAGVVLTHPDGRLIDCNEPFARTFGFTSRNEMLAHTAWDFYFQRTERDALLQQLRTHGTTPAEEVRLRGRYGIPVWVLASRAVVSRVNGTPNLLQGTVVDISVLKHAQAKIQRPEMARPIRDNQLLALSEQAEQMLQRVAKNLKVENLLNSNRAQIRECFTDLEEVQMLLSELEILRLPRE